MIYCPKPCASEIIRYKVRASPIDPHASYFYQYGTVSGLLDLIQALMILIFETKKPWQGSASTDHYMGPVAPDNRLRQALTQVSVPSSHEHMESKPLEAMTETQISLLTAGVV